MWATDTVFLNDWKEIGYAAEPLVQRMQEAFENHLRPFFPNGQVVLPIENPGSFPLKPGEPLAERLTVMMTARSMIDHFTGPDREDIVRRNDLYLIGGTFVACLSRDHDQLGQWRGYGQGGHSIGFRREALIGAAPILGAVQYGDGAVDALCDRVIEHSDGFEIQDQNTAGTDPLDHASHRTERAGYVEAVSFCLPQIALVKHAFFRPGE